MCFSVVGAALAPIPGHRRASSLARRKRRENLYRCLVQRSSRTGTGNQDGERRSALTVSIATDADSREDGQRTCLPLTHGGLIGVRRPHRTPDWSMETTRPTSSRWEVPAS